MRLQHKSLQQQTELLNSLRAQIRSNGQRNLV